MTKKKHQISSIEQDLLKLYRRRGDLLPTSIEQVAAAERQPDLERIALPPSLEQVPPLVGKQVKKSVRFWTNPSVLSLRSIDPVESIIHKARRLVMDAIE